MKYYTKEWYELLQSWGLGDSFKKIPQKEYSDAEIEELYRKKLKKEIALEKKCYNQEPFFLLLEEDLTEENFDPEDWLFIDEESGQVKIPASAKEVLEQLEMEKKAAMEEFESRPPFDPEETIQMFQEIYRTNLKTCRNNFPKWLLDSVDHRLLALDYLPEDVYVKYRSELREKKKKWDNINRMAEKEEKSQHIPKRVSSALQLHDSCLLSLKKEGQNLVMIVAKDGLWPEDATPYRKLTFKKAQILEKEPGLRCRKYMLEDFYSSNVCFMYHEIYKKQEDFEVHMMFATPGDLAYLTVACADVVYEDGITI